MVLVSAGFAMVFWIFFVSFLMNWILVETATFYILLRVCHLAYFVETIVMLEMAIVGEAIEDIFNLVLFVDDLFHVINFRGNSSLYRRAY